MKNHRLKGIASEMLSRWYELNESLSRTDGIFDRIYWLYYRHTKLRSITLTKICKRNRGTGNKQEKSLITLLHPQ